MAYEFPSNPTVGDTYDSFTWNGSAWVRASMPVEAVRPGGSDWVITGSRTARSGSRYLSEKSSLVLLATS